MDASASTKVGLWPTISSYRYRASSKRSAMHCSRRNNNGDDSHQDTESLVDFLVTKSELNVRFAGWEEDEDDWDDVLEEMEDIWMREPPALEVAGVELSPQELQQRASDGSSAQQADIETRSLSEALSGVADAHAVLLDVRSDLEFRHRSEHNAVHVPLKLLDKDSVQLIRGKAIYVLDSGDYRATQACIRLKKVFYFEKVYLVADCETVD